MPCVSLNLQIRCATRMREWALNAVIVSLANHYANDDAFAAVGLHRCLDFPSSSGVKSEMYARIAYFFFGDAFFSFLSLSSSSSLFISKNDHTPVPFTSSFWPAAYRAVSMAVFMVQ
uniref:Uncharacterized protein n=1 Tax=Chrysotila carterae TaxID=13221 RepID=A0A6T0DEB0_CHRCT